MENYIGDPKDFMRSDPAYVDLEIEGKVETFAICNDINLTIDGVRTCFSRFELARNPQAYVHVFQEIFAIQGQRGILPKKEYEFEMAQRRKGVYKHLNS